MSGWTRRELVTVGETATFLTDLLNHTTMQLADQVCTLAQAKILKELGVDQVAYFSWCGDENHYVDDKQWVFVSSRLPINSQEEDHRQLVESLNPFASAFNVAELGVMLPYEFLNASYAARDNKWFGIWKCPDKYRKDDTSWFPWGCRVIENTPGWAQTEAEARAAVLIHLLESGNITVEQVNQRLAA